MSFILASCFARKPIGICRKKIAAKNPTSQIPAARDENIVILVIAEKCVVANKRSRRYYLPTDRGYRSAAKRKNVVWFVDEADATSAGYSHS